MLLTPFSFIWVFQILILYSKILRNAYLRILLIHLSIFIDDKTFHDFTVCFRRIHSRMEATFNLAFKDVYSLCKFRIQF